MSLEEKEAEEGERDRNGGADDDDIITPNDASAEMMEEEQEGKGFFARGLERRNRVVRICWGEF